MGHRSALMLTMHLAIAAATAVLAFGDVLGAIAQQTTPSPTAPKAPAKKPVTPLPSTGFPIHQPQSADAGSPEFIFSPWTKICGKDGPEGSNAKEVCAVLTEARVESGQIAAAASLVEPRDGTQKILRVTLPLGMRLPFGTRIIIDQGGALQSNYLMCLVGCISDYDASPDMLDKLKKGQTLTIQGINPGGYQISINIPLLGFAKAYDGPPTDKNVLIERERKLEGELQRHADEARKKLEGQQPQSAQSGTPTTAPGGK